MCGSIIISSEKLKIIKEKKELKNSIIIILKNK